MNKMKKFNAFGVNYCHYSKRIAPHNTGPNRNLTFRPEI